MDIVELEERIWSAIKNHIDNGGAIGYNTWGFDIVRDKIVFDGNCRCALSCLLTDGLKVSTDDRWSLFESFGISVSQAIQFVDAFDSVDGFDDPIFATFADSEFFKMGARLRERVKQFKPINSK